MFARILNVIQMQRGPLVVLVLFSLLTQSLTAQVGRDTVEVRQKLGTTYRVHGTPLTPAALMDHTRGCTEAYSEMKVAKQNYDWGYGFGFVGGLLVGWPLGTAAFGGKPNWAMAGVGLGLVGVSIPFSIAYNRHAKRAARLYNDQVMGR